MKKFSTLIALALFTVAGTGYASEGNPFDVPAAQMKLSLELSFGDRHEVNYVPMQACRLVDTRIPQNGKTYFVDREVRAYTTQGCRVPENAEHVVLKVTAIGLRVPISWSSPGAGFYTTTPNSATDEVGGLLGGGKPAIVFVEAGRTAVGSAIVELKAIPVAFQTYKGFELKLENGDAVHAVVDVVGYTVAKITHPTTGGGLAWKGIWSSTSTYTKGDIVKAVNGLWTCVASNGAGCLVWDQMWK